jgi:hypothetical protein
MEEPKLIPMHDYIKKQPVQLKLWPIEDYEQEYEDHTKNNSEGLSELETKQAD